MRNTFATYGPQFLDAFVPDESIMFPSGATHCKIIANVSEMALATEHCVVASSSSDRIGLSHECHEEIVLTQSCGSCSTNPILLAMGIVFYQQVNGQFYVVANRIFNAFAFVDVDGG